MTRITIDRENGTVERIRGFFFWQKRELFELSRFDNVRLFARATAVEEGYERMWYSVYLERPGLSLELLSTDVEGEAGSLHWELAECLAAVERSKTGSASER